MKKFVSVLLILCLLLSMMSGVIAVGADEYGVAANIGENTFTVNETTEFTVTTYVGESAEPQTVISSLELYDSADNKIEDVQSVVTLEYLDELSGVWNVFTSTFGPAEGYEMVDSATYSLKATFKTEGDYKAKILVKDVEDENKVLCQTEAMELRVAGVEEESVPSTVSVNIPAEFTAEEAAEFTVTAVANDDAGKEVYGVITFADVADLNEIVTLELQGTDGQWTECDGTFTFTLEDSVTNTFRATFNDGGAYKANVQIKDVATDAVLCESEEIAINVTPKYTISGADSNEAGTIVVSSEKVTAGETVEITVTANEGYEIQEIFINDTEATVTDVNSVTLEITPEEDIVVRATFIKLFTISVSYGENGEVTVNESAVPADGKVIVKETAGQIVVTATPYDGYRVGSFAVDNVEEEFDPVNSQGYSVTLTEMKDYTIEIGFERNIYSVEIDNKENVTLDEAKVNHGDSIEVTVATPKGERISQVLVNDKEKTVTLEEAGGHWKHSFELTVTEDLKIQVVFAEAEMVEDDYQNFFNAGDAVTVKDNIFVFKKDATVSFNSGDYNRIYTNAGTELKESKTITEIWVEQKPDDSDYSGWHQVQIPEGGLKIVIDKTEPEINTGFDTEIIYNENVSVPFEITDADVGVESVSYQVGYMNEGEFVVTESGNSEPADGKYRIPVTADKNNRHGVIVKVTALDKAGNSSEKSVTLNMDNTLPEISIDWVDEHGVVDADAYYDSRNATICIQERAESFDGDSIRLYVNDEPANTNYIHITARNAAGETVAFDAGDLVWTLVEDTAGNPDADIHKAAIPFEKDAVYTIEIAYTDKAGNEGTNYKEAFVVDNLDPTGEIVAQLWHKIVNEPEDDEVIIQEAVTAEPKWDELVGHDKLVFGQLSSPIRIDVKATSTDATSGVAKVESYKTDATTALTEEALNSVSWKIVEDLDNIYTTATDERFTVYLKITDKAGNFTYISTNGLILDTQKPVDGNADQFAPQINMTEVNEESKSDGIYNESVTIAVNIMDPIVNKDVFSGLQSVTYNIKALDMEDTKEDGVPLDENIIEDEATGLIRQMTGTIEINADKFNSNNVRLIVTAVDNAGNVATFEKTFKIDVTPPAIRVEYSEETEYSNNTRTAEIYVTDRNFVPFELAFSEKLEENTENTIAATFGSEVEVSEWEPVEVSEEDKQPNGDHITYRKTVTFSKDDHYQISALNTVDVAGNAGNHDPGAVFTIDKTLPKVSVSYDNNSAENDKYFKNYRTATVTIVEHNFDSELVTFNQGAKRGGVAPKVNWRPDGSGDTHTATFVYNIDGDYTFDVTMKDLAGNESAPANYGSSVAGKDFIIDTTYKDMISQSGVENGVAYGHDAEVIPNIKISDINLQNYTVTLTGVQKDKTIDLTNDVNALLSKGAETVTGILDIFETKQDLDGIYTLKMNSKDKAGNEDSMEIVFTVNRFGSVYVFEDYLLNLVKDGGAYVQKVENDLVLTEYNADKLLADSLKIEITVDGKPLENVQYTVSPEINDQVAVGSSGWYQYKYVISKDNFQTDGIYKISVASEDATGNTPENSNYEDKGMTFRVDSTKSEITSVVGLEDAIVNAQEITVKYTVFDTIGIKRIAVYVSGVIADEITDFAADPNNYSGSFKLAEKNTAQAVQIVVEDLAGNITDTSAEDFTPAYEFHGSVTVSTNIFVRWYANKWLFWGSIGGIAVMIAVVLALIANKKKKAA